MKNKPVIYILGAVVIVLLVVTIGLLVTSTGTPTQPTNNNAQTTNSGTTGTTPEPSTTGTSVPTTNHKDGTYSATGTYISPAGSETIGVQVNLKDDIVTGLTVTPMAKDSKSKTYQQLFVSGVSSQVVGKSIDAVNLGKINGSSLTPIGFQDALEKIKDQSELQN